MIAADRDRAWRAALIWVATGVPYVDAFGVELADEVNGTLVTAAVDFKPASRKGKLSSCPRSEVKRSMEICEHFRAAILPPD